MGTTDNSLNDVFQPYFKHFSNVMLLAALASRVSNRLHTSLLLITGQH